MLAGSSTIRTTVASTRIAVPSLTMATVFFLMVSSWASSGSASIALHTRATPGV